MVLVPQWEYQLVRLNIEPPVAAPQEPPPVQDAPASETNILWQGQDPAFQLQDFLNGQGQQGWELVGFQHAPPHVIIVFKRPAAGQESARAAQSEQLRLTLDLANRALAVIEKQSS